MLMSSVVYASEDIGYLELKNELLENNSTLKVLDLSVLNMGIDVYKTNLQSKSMVKTVDKLTDLPFFINGSTMAPLMYVRDIVPMQVGYGYFAIKGNAEVTESALTVALRQMSTGLISTIDAYELSVEKFNFYESEYKNAVLKFELGLISQSNLFASEVKRQETLTSKNRSKRALDESYMGLNNFVDFDLDKTYEIVREKKFNIVLKDPTYYLDFALEYRFEILDFNQKIQLQSAIIDFYDYADFLAFYPNWKAREDAKMEKKQLEYDLQLEIIKITEEIYSAVSDINIFSHKIDQLQNTLTIQENEYANLKAQVERGNITESVIKELEFAITSIKNNLDIMNYSYNTKHYELHNASFIGPAYGGGM